MDFYKVHRVLYDVTITSMTAGQLLELDQTMSAGGTSYRTNKPGVPTTTDISGTYLGEIDSIEIISPIGTNGQPILAGLNIWFTVDAENYRHYIDIPADGPTLFFPLHVRTYGGSHLARLLGEPFWKLALKGLAGHTVSSMPLRNSTIKYAQYFGVTVYSANGFTAASGYGLRIIVKGYLYQANDIAKLAPGWQTSITYQTDGRETAGLPELNTTFPVSSSDLTFSPNVWQAMPGGVRQASPKVSPYVHYAVNASPTTPQTRFALSNNSTTYGGAGHVQNQYQDLGESVTTGTALLIKAYGLAVISRPSNIARFGFVVDGTEVPEQPNSSQAGWGISDSVNDYYFGDVGPYIGDFGTGTGYAQLYRPIPHPDGEPWLIYKNNFAPFIADNGTPIPAGAVMFAEQGVIVEGV
jgi:hypothetical protein